MRVSGTTTLYAVFGNPNKNNPTPAGFNAACEASGVDAVHVAFETEDIALAMRAVRSLGMGGGAITKPFKQEVMQYLDEIDEAASAIGAVNVVENRDGLLIGHNSDWLGALGALSEVTAIEAKRVALLGAGGAAAAIGYGLRSAGATTVVFNRSEAHAIALCERFDCILGGPLDAVTPDFDVIINATSVGMSPNEDANPLTVDAIKNQPIVFDIVPTPRRTRLLAMAEEYDCMRIEGVQMIAHLAVPTLEFLTGTTPSLRLLLEHFSDNAD